MSCALSFSFPCGLDGSNGVNCGLFSKAGWSNTGNVKQILFRRNDDIRGNGFCLVYCTEEYKICDCKSLLQFVHSIIIGNYGGITI